jgi:hypothetical protein
MTLGGSSERREECSVETKQCNSLWLPRGNLADPRMVVNLAGAVGGSLKAPQRYAFGQASTPVA